MSDNAAANPRVSAWVAANAGAGKTYLLANRVTRLLLEKIDPAKILCLTYTKAAAAEMQSRLFKRLGEWAMLSDTKLTAEIIGIDGPVDDLPEARRLFAKALETPGGLKIQTIHAFCQNLLTRFPIEARITPSFQVLDEQTTRDLLAEARTQVLETATGEVAAAIAHLATETSEARMQQILDAALGTDRRKLDRFLARGGDMRAALRKAHEESEDADAIATTFCRELRHDLARLEECQRWLAGGSKQDIERATALTAVLSASSDNVMFGALRDALLSDKGERYARYATKKLGDSRRDLHDWLEDMIGRFCVQEQRYRAARGAALAEATLILARAIRDRYADAKRIRSALDYDDLITETVKLLERSDAAQWVLFKLDGGIDHVLIDEAQDTSPEQWRIVQRLTEEFFSGEGRKPLQARTVFAVGDEKQSIFSFQGADPVHFARNRSNFMMRALGANVEFLPTDLPQSRRSLPEILRFVDQVFEDPEAAKGLTSEGKDILHRPVRTDDIGLVELWPSVPAPPVDKIDPWAPVDVRPENSPVVTLAQRIARQIKNWIDSGLCLPGHTKAVRPADIMILLPRREPFASEIIRQLKHAGVPVAGADRMLLTQQIAAVDLIALGRFALLPEDDLTLATVLRSPLARVGEDALFELSHARKGSLWRTLGERKNERPEFSDAHAFLDEMLKLADFKPPFEFYSHALNALKMKTRLLERLGVEALDAVDEFLSLALTYEGTNTPSLEGFLHWIERGAAEVKRDMERARDEVRVMTVHGAKGLEADIVILPDTTTLPDAPTLRGNLLYTEDGVLFPLAKPDSPVSVRRAKDAAAETQLEEYRRLLYVALTRAKDRLYICGFENRFGVRNGSWYSHAQRAVGQMETTPLVDGGHRIGTDSATVLRAANSNAVAQETLPNWAVTPPPKEIVRPRLIRPFDAAGTDEPATISPLSEKDARRFARGLLVHSLLARLPEIAAENRHGLALRFLSQRGVADDEAVALADATLGLLTHGDFARAFGPGSKPEVAIVADLPELGEGVRINGRIDRIAVTENEVLIVDFKTNRPPPTKEQDVPALYATQMALYRAAAAKIFPNRRIACALVWTEGPHLMTLSDALLDAETARIRERLLVPAAM